MLNQQQQKTIQKTRTHGKNWLNSGKIISDTVKDVPRESMVVIDGRNIVMTKTKLSMQVRWRLN